MSPARQSSIYVIAGVNGAGKSSIGGATFRQLGGDYYNPDEVARKLITASLVLTQAQANGLAWQGGVTMLRRAIKLRRDFAFETTLGANTIPRLLTHAAKQGIKIHVWYVGLSSPELHLARVRSRVLLGGHDIPEADIRRRYTQSRSNLIALMPLLTALRVFDNSADADPDAGQMPKPVLILHTEKRKILNPLKLAQTPEWAKPIVMAALKATDD